MYIILRIALFITSVLGVIAQPFVLFSVYFAGFSGSNSSIGTMITESGYLQFGCFVAAFVSTISALLFLLIVNFSKTARGGFWYLVSSLMASGLLFFLLFAEGDMAIDEEMFLDAVLLSPSLFSILAYFLSRKIGTYYD